MLCISKYLHATSPSEMTSNIKLVLYNFTLQPEMTHSSSCILSAEALVASWLGEIQKKAVWMDIIGSNFAH